jgi:hypothetical protein
MEACVLLVQCVTSQYKAAVLTCRSLCIANQKVTSNILPSSMRRINHETLRVLKDNIVRSDFEVFDLTELVSSIRTIDCIELFRSTCKFTGNSPFGWCSALSNSANEAQQNSTIETCRVLQPLFPPGCILRDRSSSSMSSHDLTSSSLNRRAGVVPCRCFHFQRLSTPASHQDMMIISLTIACP